MLNKCMLCKRECGVNRLNGEIGFCKAPKNAVVARASLHMWEEPVISGERGSGTIFFSGCSLGCIYCQNKDISRSNVGKCITDNELSLVMLELERRGAHNINFVTPTHFVPSVINSTETARQKGLSVPIVYNTASYEGEGVIDSLSDTVDIWLPDLKYYRQATALAYSSASDLPDVSRRNIERMVALSPEPVFGDDGLMKRGVIVRILLLPGHLAEAKLNLKYLYSAFGNSIYVSLMSQYTPTPSLKPPLDRRVTHSEYEELVDYALTLGMKNAFTQEFSSADEIYVPDFFDGGTL